MSGISGDILNRNEAKIESNSKPVVVQRHHVELYHVVSMCISKSPPGFGSGYKIADILRHKLTLDSQAPIITMTLLKTVHENKFRQRWCSLHPRKIGLRFAFFKQYIKLYKGSGMKK